MPTTVKAASTSCGPSTLGRASSDRATGLPRRSGTNTFKLCFGVNDSGSELGIPDCTKLCFQQMHKGSFPPFLLIASMKHNQI